MRVAHKKEFCFSLAEAGARSGAPSAVATNRARTLLEVKIADPRAPVETAVYIIVFGRVPEGEVVHRINGH